MTHHSDTSWRIIVVIGAIAAVVGVYLSLFGFDDLVNDQNCKVEQRETENGVVGRLKEWTRGFIGLEGDDCADLHADEKHQSGTGSDEDGRVCARPCAPSMDGKMPQPSEDHGQDKGPNIHSTLLTALLRESIA